MVSLTSLSGPGSKSGSHIACRCHSPLVFLNLKTFLNVARYLVECLRFGIVWFFLMNLFRFCVLRKTITKGMLYPSQCITSGSLGYLSVPLLARFCHEQLSSLSRTGVCLVSALLAHYCFLFVINKYLVERNCKTMQMFCFSSKFHPLILAHTGHSCLNQLLLWCLPNGGFLSLLSLIVSKGSLVCSLIYIFTY